MPARTDRGEPLFREDFLDTLAYLHVLATKIVQGRMKALRRSRKRGVSAEFADHRAYSPGDDFRFIDWSVFLRTEQLFLRLFEDEEDLVVHILLDCSGSMDAGAPYKFHYARRLAATLAYLALISHDTVQLHCVGAGLGQGAGTSLQVRGRNGARRVLSFLEGLSATGPTDFARSGQQFCTRGFRRGLVILLTDAYDANGMRPCLDALRFGKHEAFLVQIVSPEEAEPGVSGDIRLVDQETGAHRDITVNERTRRRYREAFEGYCRDLQRFCLSKGLGYGRFRTDMPFQDAIVKLLQEGPLLR
ncbi:MAG: DUF58 domain-containing protein [Candidatus Hydrogenedentes bacterium]|nr:DUF58 domain-containing protein [Candidatus Hydrogenedentota bacterium]